MLHGGHKFHEAFQMKQGRFDLQAAKISEMMKSNNLDVLYILPKPFYLIILWTLCSSIFISKSFVIITYIYMQNAPTQSLLSIATGILDDSIERNNGEVPQVHDQQFSP